MADLTFRDDHVSAFVAGARRALLVRSPAKLADPPALFFILAADRRRCFAEPAYAPLIEGLLRAGHRVASFDLPNHGDRIDAYGEGLTGMAAAVTAGIDVFLDVVETGRAMLDLAVAEGWAQPGRVAAAGISRGALGALNWAAEDDRLAAVAAFAPVTDLPTLSEFAGLRDSPIVQRRNALALTARLRNRSIFLIIPREDPRVGTANCRRFYEALCDMPPPTAEVVFELTEGNVHSLPAEAYARGAHWLIETITPETPRWMARDAGRIG